MKAPVIVLVGWVVIALVTAVVAGNAASSERDKASFNNAVALEAAVADAALSNLALIMAGVGLVGLLVLWGVAKAVARPVVVRGV